MDIHYPKFSAFRFQDETTTEFDKFGFSRFKYGSVKWTKILSYQFFDRYIYSTHYEALCNAIQSGMRVHVYPPPYINVPTAGFFLAKHFVDLLNEYLYENGYSPVFMGKIYRKKSYSTDYGNLEISEREAIFKDELFYTDSNILQNDFSIFFDDIRITGSHENRIFKMLEEIAPNNTSNFQFLYYAILDDLTCHPSIEHKLNTYSLKDYRDIENLIHDDGIYWNTRVVKYLLELPTSQFIHFLNNLESDQIRAFYHCCINNHYCILDSFIDNFNILKLSMKSNSKLERIL